MPDQTIRYEIRPSTESTFILEVFKTGLLTGKKHLLFFEQYAGEIDYNRERPEGSTVRLTVQASSVTCQDPWIKSKDRRKKIAEVAVNDMMAANQYPQLNFCSTRVTSQAKGQYEIEGSLTVRGIAKPVTLHAAVRPVGEHRLELDGDAQIDLKDYGIKPPSVLLGVVGTKSKMTLRFLTWAEKSVGREKAFTDCAPPPVPAQ
jgi:polyisoprenoid-binding protein YceI